MNHFLTIKLRKMRNIQKIIPLGIHFQFLEGIQNGIYITYGKFGSI